MEHDTMAFRLMDQAKAHYALFIRSDNIIAEDGLIIQIFEKFFLNYHLEDSLIARPKFFEILVKIELSLIVIWLWLTHRNIMLIFYIEFSLLSRFFV